MSLMASVGVVVGRRAEVFPSVTVGGGVVSCRLVVIASSVGLMEAPHLHLLGAAV